MMSAETNQAKSALVVALRRLARVFWVILAIIFLFEAWLWAQLAPVVAFVVALLFAKLAGLGVTAFIFEVTRPKLMQMTWFARLYGIVMRGLAWAHAMVDP